MSACYLELMKEKSTATPKTKAGRHDDPHTAEIKRYIGAVSEDFQHRVAAIGEQFVGLNKKLDSHTEMIGVMQEDIAVVKTRVVHIEQKLDMHTEMIGAMQEDITVMKSDIETIKADLKKKVDYDEFQALARRVAVLEQKSRR